MSVLPTSPSNSDRNEELDHLHERLRTLNVKTADDVFLEMRLLSAEYDIKAADVSEQIALIEEELPSKLKALREKKTLLKGIKTEVLSTLAEYKLHAKKVHEITAKHCPEVVDALASISAKTQKLEELRCQETARNLVDTISLALNDDDADAVGKALHDAKGHLDNMLLLFPSGLEAFRDRLSEVGSNVDAWATKRLEKILSSIGWPWSDKRDERAYKAEITELHALLGAAYDGMSMEDPTIPPFSRLCSLFFKRVDTSFRYHFYGDRETANPCRPDYFLTQLILWMQNSIDLYSMVLQPVMDKHKIRSTTAHDEFVQRVCTLAEEKTCALLASPEYGDSTIFSKIIDELISFEEQREEWGFCPGRFSTLQVLCEEETRKKWQHIEAIACTARIDDVLSSETRWSPRMVDIVFDDVDPLLVCEAADSFVGLLLCIRARSRSLPCSVTRTLFVDLQVMLIDDFRMRLGQIKSSATSPWETPWPQIMNAMWYMAVSLEEWGELDLVSAVDEEEGRTSVRKRLGESLKSYKHVWEQMANDVVKTFQAQLERYADAYAQSFPRSAADRLRAPYAVSSSSSGREISAAFCPFLMKVRTALTSTADKTCRPAVADLARMLLSAVATVLEQRVIANVHINAEQAEQMQWDIRTGLVSVVNAILSRADVTARMEREKGMLKVLSSLRLLSLSAATAMLLREEIVSVSDEEAEEKLLAMELYSLSREGALALFKRRSDIRIEGADDSHLKIGLR